MWFEVSKGSRPYLHVPGALAARILSGRRLPACFFFFFGIAVGFSRRFNFTLEV
jgi:hypothetical protein